MATFALLASMLVAGTSVAGEAEDKCTEAIAKAGAKHFATVAKTLSKCELSRSGGKLDPGDNCRPSVDPLDDAKSADKISKSADKVLSALQKSCADANLSLLVNAAPCDAPSDLTDLADCLADDAYGADAEALIETVFGSTVAPVALTTTAKCQKSTAGAVVKLASARAKERAKCLKGLASGKVGGPCPDAATHAKLDGALTKTSDKIRKVCTAAGIDGDADDVLPGFPCDLFIDATFDRAGATNGNFLSIPARFARCMLAAGAGYGDLVADRAAQLPESGPFLVGVAAGDATDTSFMAWTRSTAGDDITIEVATSETFSPLAFTDTATPDAGADLTVKFDVTGLDPATQYFYRFQQNTDTSRVGRIRTLESSVLLDSFTFAFTGDSNAAFKPFSVLDQITEVDPEFWLYIGDTIYGDDPRSGSGIATVRAEYHDKYEENRNDRALRDLLANVGVYAIWDDHEVTNDFWGKDPAIQVQMAEGNQALRDYFPIRENGGDPEQLYRSFKVGELAEFFMLDDRQYRDAQADLTEPACIEGVCSVTLDTCTGQSSCDAIQPGQTCHKGTCSDTGDPCSLVADCDLIQGGQTCDPNSGAALPGLVCQAEIDATGREYLGATQLAWLKDGLLNSTATFKFVANGPLIQELLFVPYDRWDGYTAERQDLLDHIDTNSIENVVFLSTDIHAAIVNDAVGGTSVREIVAGAVGMDPIIRELPGTVGALVPQLPLFFPDVKFYDIDRFNVGIINVTSSAMKMQWHDGSGQLLKQLVFNAAP